MAQVEDSIVDQIGQYLSKYGSKKETFILPIDECGPKVVDHCDHLIETIIDSYAKQNVEPVKICFDCQMDAYESRDKPVEIGAKVRCLGDFNSPSVKLKSSGRLDIISEKGVKQNLNAEMVIIEKGGYINGDVKCVKAEVHGTLDGELDADEVYFSSSSKIRSIKTKGF